MITGAAGFLGTHLIKYILENKDWDIVCADRLDFSGNLNRTASVALKEAHKDRIRQYYIDLRAPINDTLARMLTFEKEPCEGSINIGICNIKPFDYIIHLAAGTHVDRSISDPLGFVQDNVVGTSNLLEAIRLFGEFFLREGTGKFYYQSTDEVCGPAPEGKLFKEWEQWNPNNPYAATKAAAEMICISFASTYKIPIVIGNLMNIIGEYQSSEKFLPLVIKKVLKGEKVTIHASADKKKSGTRFYLHAGEAASAICHIIEHGDVLGREGNTGKYNIVGKQEVSNLELAQAVAEALGKPLDYELVDFHSSRPGHDPRYGLDGARLEAIGWKPDRSFNENVKKVVDWYLLPENKQWLL
jgi:dTDP-glucose 4,6-dehydratase